LSALSVGFVTGLTAEAAIARRMGMPVEAGGGTPEGAERAAERLVAVGVRSLISFGLAGGLDPALRPGDVVIPIAVTDGSDTYPTDKRLSDTLGGWFGGVLYASPKIAVTVLEKARLSAITLGGSIDMESGAVARVAQRHGIPFAVLRAVCDPADRNLPPAALVALSAKGRIALARVAISILFRPQQIPGLIALARDASRARRALVGRVNQIGGSLRGVL